MNEEYFEIPDEELKTEDEIRLLVEKGEDLIPEVVKIADNNNVKINSIELKHPSLEEVFIKYTGRKIGDRVKN